MGEELRQGPWGSSSLLRVVLAEPLAWAEDGDCPAGVQALGCSLLTGGWIRRESKSTASTVTEAWGPFPRFHFIWPGAQPRRWEVQPLQEILW